MGTANTFGSMNANFKQSYSDEKKPKFKKLRKAMSESRASENPMKALKDKSYLNLKGKRGVAV